MCMYVYVHILTFVASVSSLISGDPLDDINVNNTADMYTAVFNSSRNLDMGVSDYVNTYSAAVFIWALGIWICMHVIEVSIHTLDRV